MCGLTGETQYTIDVSHGCTVLLAFVNLDLVLIFLILHLNQPSSKSTKATKANVIGRV